MPFCRPIPNRLFLLALCTCVSVLSACANASQPDSGATPAPQAAASSEPAPATNQPAVSPSAVVASASPYPRRPLTPTQDQVPAGSSFNQFRSQLQQAVQARDAQFIQAIADPDIKITFGPPMPFSQLGFDDPKSLSWKRLERLLSIGCTPYEAPAATTVEAYQCPSLSQSAIGDPFSDIHIIGTNVNVRSQPSAESETIGTLTHELVKFDSAGFEQLTEQQRNLSQTFDGWMPIITPEGKRGFVSSRYAYFPAGYRARFEQRQGQWKMTIFIAGD